MFGGGKGGRKGRKGSKKGRIEGVRRKVKKNMRTSLTVWRGREGGRKKARTAMLTLLPLTKSGGGFFPRQRFERHQTEFRVIEIRVDLVRSLDGRGSRQVNARSMLKSNSDNPTPLPPLYSFPILHTKKEQI